MASPALILASTSAYRRALLARFGIAFETVSPGIDERHHANELPVDRALRLSIEKAKAVAMRYPDAVVIGSDQVAAANGRVLDKPGNAEVCREQLGFLSGSTAHFYTACAVAGPGGHTRGSHIDTTSVVFRALSPDEIDRYIEKEQPFDCAGGFKVEALGITLFEHVESEDPTALVGLPLIWLAGALRDAGFALP
jgi:septum formation protein